MMIWPGEVAARLAEAEGSLRLQVARHNEAVL